MEPIDQLQLRYQQARIQDELQLPKMNAEELERAMTELQRVLEDVQILMENEKRLNHNHAKTGAIRQLLDDIQLDLGVYQRFLVDADSLSLNAILNERDEPTLLDAENSSSVPAAPTSDIAPAISASANEGTAMVRPGRSHTSNREERMRRLRSQSNMSVSQRSASTSRAGSPVPPLFSPHRSVVSSNSVSPSYAPSLSTAVPFANHSRMNTNGGGHDDNDAITPLRFIDLQPINDHLYSDHSFAKFGHPTFIHVSGVLAVGTSNGSIILFDYDQQVLGVLGTKASEGAELAGVSAISISPPPHAYLAAGYTNGHIIIWDLNQLSIIKQIHPKKQAMDANEPEKPEKVGNAHRQGCAITSLKFSPVTRYELMSGDERGAVCYHVIQTGLLMLHVESYTLVKGSEKPLNSLKPSVFQIAVLPARSMKVDSAPWALMNAKGLFSFITAYQVVLLASKPQIHVEMNIKRDNPASCGCVAFLPAEKAIDQHGNEFYAEPLFAYSFDNQLYLHKMQISLERNERGKNSLSLREFFQWQCDDVIASVTIVDRRTILAISASAYAFFIDIKSKTVSETVFLDQKSKLVANTPMTSSIHRYTASVSFIKNRFFFLYNDCMKMALLRNWEKRLRKIAACMGFVDAIEMSIQLFHQKPGLTVVGLPVAMTERTSRLKGLITEFLSSYIQEETDKLQDDVRMTQQQFVLFQDFIIFVIEVCLTIGDTDLVFNQLFEGITVGELQTVFFNSLTAYILQDQLTVIPPAIFNSLLDDRVNLIHSGQFDYADLEEMLMHLDPAGIDVDHAFRVCREHRLTGALMVVSLRSLQDPVLPLIEIIPWMRKCIENATRTAAESHIGYKVFVYLSFVLSGRSFPSGLLSDSLRTKAREGIWSFLLSDVKDPSVETCNLAILIQWDVRECFKVLLSCLDDQYWKHEAQSSKTGSERQRILSALKRVMTALEGHKNQHPENFFYYQVFLCNFYASHSTFYMSATELKDIESCFFRHLDVDQHAIAESCLRNLYPVLKKRLDLDEKERFLHKCRDRKFWRVCELMFWDEKRWSSMVSCWVHDTDGVMDLTALLSGNKHLSRFMSYPPVQLSAREKEEIRQLLISSAAEWVAEHGGKLSVVIQQFFPKDHARILEAFTSRTDLQFTYLSGIMEDETWNQSVGSDLFDTYLTLMVRPSPATVCKYIERFHDKLRLDRALALCKEHHLLEATVWILERTGSIHDALTMILREYQQQSKDELHSILTSKNLVITETPTSSSNDSERATMCTITNPTPDTPIPMDLQTEQHCRSLSLQMTGWFKMAKRLCQRHVPSLKREACDALWTTFMDRLHDAHAYNLHLIRETNRVLGDSSTTAQDTPSVLDGPPMSATTIHTLPSTSPNPFPPPLFSAPLDLLPSPTHTTLPTCLNATLHKTMHQHWHHLMQTVLPALHDPSLLLHRLFRTDPLWPLHREWVHHLLAQYTQDVQTQRTLVHLMVQETVQVLREGVMRPVGAHVFRLQRSRTRRENQGTGNTPDKNTGTSTTPLPPSISPSNPTSYPHPSPLYISRHQPICQACCQCLVDAHDTQSFFTRNDSNQHHQQRRRGLKVFPCGHGYHSTCCPGTWCFVCEGSDALWPDPPPQERGNKGKTRIHTGMDQTELKQTRSLQSQYLLAARQSSQQPLYHQLHNK